MTPSSPARRIDRTYRNFLVGLVLLMLLGFGIRVAAAVAWQTRMTPGPEQPFVWGDSQTYWEIAQGYVEHGRYEFGTPPQVIFRAPGYPSVLIAAMQLADWAGRPLTVFQARLVGCLLGSLAIGLLAAWTYDLSGDRRASLLAAACLAVEPGAIAMSIFILAEAAFVPLMILSLWAWSSAWQHPKWWLGLILALLTGLVTGAAILVRPSWLLFAPFTAAALLVVCGQRRRQVLQAAVIGLGIALAMSPWWYRNYQWTGRWVPTTLQVGASLYDGWNPQADGSSDMTHGYRQTRPLLQQYRQQREQHTYRGPTGTAADAADSAAADAFDLAADGAFDLAADGAAGLAADSAADGAADGAVHRAANRSDRTIADQAAIQLELDSNDRLRSQATQWARENPGQVARLFLIKVWRTWRPWPTAAEVNSPVLTIVTVAAYLPLLLLALLAALAYCRRDPAWSLCLWPAIYFTILHGIFVGSIRYRQPAMVALIPLAAVLLAHLWRRARPTSPQPSRQTPTGSSRG